jgi:hypothetical protein
MRVRHINSRAERQTTIEDFLKRTEFCIAIGKSFNSDHLDENR